MRHATKEIGEHGRCGAGFSCGGDDRGQVEPKRTFNLFCMIWVKRDVEGRGRMFRRVVNVYAAGDLESMPGPQSSAGNEIVHGGRILFIWLGEPVAKTIHAFKGYMLLLTCVDPTPLDAHAMIGESRNLLL